MSLERRLRDGLRRDADPVSSDIDQDLALVRREARRRIVRRRIVGAAALTVVLLALLLAAPSISNVVDSFRSEVTPTPGATTVPNPFAITGRIDLAALGIRHPLAFAVGPDGNLYVTDAGQTVNVISPDGKLLHSWGSPGTGPGQFRLESGRIAVGADGSVYVSDSGNFRVQVFTSDGTFMRQLGGFGSRPGTFQLPFDIAVDDRGNVYVADDRLMTVTRFSPRGRFVWRLGGPTETTPDLIGHEHFSGVDPAGRLVMANDELGKIVYVGRNGQELDAFGEGSGGRSSSTHPAGGDFPNGACDVSVDAAGYTVVDSCQDPSSPTHDTELLDPSHQLVGAWHGSPFAFSPRFGPNGEAYALSYDGEILKLSITLPQG